MVRCAKGDNDMSKGLLYVCDKAGANAEPLNVNDEPYTRDDALMCDVDPDGEGVRLRASSTDDDCSDVDFVAVNPAGDIVGYYKFVTTCKLLVLQYAHGARLDNWQDLRFADSIDDARGLMAHYIGLHADEDDRGEEYEAEWEALAGEAKTAEVGDVISFDERAWRIVEDVE